MSPSTPHPRNVLVLLAGIICMAVILIAPGCSDDKATMAPLEETPTGSIAVFEATPDVLFPDDVATLRVRVMEPDGSTPAPGRVVAFSELFGRRLGTFAADSVRTDAAGWASNTFVHDRGITGYTNLKATVGSESKYKEVTLAPPLSELITVVITPGEGEAKAIADGETRFPYTVLAYGTQTGEALSGLEVVLTSGEQFLDDNEDGLYNSGEAFKDDNKNGRWDPIGTLPEHVVTDRYGSAEFELTAPSTAGTAYIHACAMGAWTEAPMEFVPKGLKIDVHPRATETIADGYSSIGFDIWVSDWLGNPVGGKMLRFTAGEEFADANLDGQYSAGETFVDGNENGVWDVSGSVVSPVLCDETGYAFTAYTPSLTWGLVLLHAVCEDQYVDTSIHVYQSALVGTMSLDVWFGEFQYADGMKQIDITLDTRDVNGEAARSKLVTLVAGEPFDDVNHDGVFTPGRDVLLQDLDRNGTWTAIGTLQPTVVTDRYGDARVTYTAGTIPGNIEVRATVDGVAARGTIVLTPFPNAPDLRMFITPTEIYTRGTGHDDSAVIQVSVWDFTRGHSVAGMPVSFEIVSGPGGSEQLVDAVSNVYTTSTDQAGDAFATVMAGTEAGPISVAIRAGQVRETATIFVRESDPAFVELTCLKTSLGLYERVNVSANVKDAGGNAVPDRTPVEFSCDEGMVVGDEGNLSYTQDGVAVAAFHALGPAEDRDYRAVVVAHAVGTEVADSLAIRILDQSPASIEARADDDDLSVGEETMITIDVRDKTGGPARDGTIVEFSTQEGMVVSVTGGELRDGRTYCTYRCTGTDTSGDGVAIVRCQVEQTSLTADVVIAIPRGTATPATVSLSAAASEISVRGVGEADQTILTAQPLDAHGRRYGADVPVTFRIVSGPSGGETINGAGTEAMVWTAADGKAEAVLNAGTRSGTVVVEAVSGTATSAAARLVIAAGPPAYIECAVGDVPDSVFYMDCNMETTVKVHVTDQYRNPVQDGTRVWFYADAGLIVGDGDLASSATEDGQATATYFSPLQSACAAWVETVVSFECRPLDVCTGVIRKGTAP